MKKATKLTAAALAATLSLSLAACGSSASTGTASTSASADGVVYRTLDEIKADGTINIGVFSDKNPFGYVDENGEYQGYDIYFANRLAEDLGVKVNYVSTEAANRIEYLQTGKVDIILANFTVTPERAEEVDFALPYMNVALGVVSPDSNVITSLDSWNADDQMIVISGTTAETYLTQNYPDIPLQKYDSYATAKSAMENGGVAWANDNTEVIAFASQNPGYTVGIPSLGSQDTIAPAVSKGNETLLNAINDEIKALGKENFFHADYEATLVDTYGTDYEDSLVVEGGETSPDISGLIGQYAHGNEPSHHILYLYTMLGQPWKTAGKVREVLTTLYHDRPDGLSGNEDVGQMSAWYVLSSLGMYEAEPAGGRYWFGSPLFDRAEVKVPSGVFTITAENNSAANKYIQRVWLNGQPYTKPWIGHADVMKGGELRFEMGAEEKVWYCPDEPEAYADQRPAEEQRLFKSEAVEGEIARVCGLLTNERLRWMFANCFPNTLDTTVHYGEDEAGNPDTYVYTGDIPAMWLRDSGAQVWPYVQLCKEDPALRKMIAGVIRRQLKLINIDPYANAFNVAPTGAHNKTDFPQADPMVFERKWEIDSHCYPLRLAHHYWKTTGDTSVFDGEWTSAMRNIVKTLREQQMKEGPGDYTFLRTTDRQLDTRCHVGRGNPVKPVGLIVSAFRPSDDATTFGFLVPSNFMAVTSLRKAAEILTAVNGERELAAECTALADEVAGALQQYAVVEHPEFGKIYAFEVDGFGGCFLMDDANVPSLLAMPYLGDVERTDPIYENTRRFVWSTENPYFWRGAAGEGIGGPHIGVEMIWPMSIMMRAFTATDDEEIRDCICQLITTDAGTGFMHESFSRHDAADFTRAWFAWQNTLFGELILKLVNDGKTDLLNSIR